eukprot:CAMPEP_0197185248 /NCGR_PEP_ID=MMETSP1423-20130617/11521_1 /TAXON_ID=476441 /ORGANISM="Pseudo-nitzschia heimii, Strain UNC1101" /LENGTH=322 /DNA_ID=CAMNT_0042636263 /DNA_START=129 /DNA_END=1097 /DNA_ORIENTATION=+
MPSTPIPSACPLSSPTSVLALVGGEDPADLGGKNRGDTLREIGSGEYFTEMMATTTARMDPRSCILEVGAAAGKLCCVANRIMVPERIFVDDDDDREHRDDPPSSEPLTEALVELFASLWLTAKSLRLDWVKSIRSKMALNAKKYPAEHCKGKAGKYTKYSHLTGITTSNQSTMDYREKTETENPTDAIDLSLAGFAEQHLAVLAEEIQTFAEDRQWARFHTPRNLVLALLGEAGELAEILQWDKEDWEVEDDTKDDEPRPLLVDRLHSCEPQRLDELSQELADVSIYALRLATVCGLIGDLRESLVKQEPPPDLEAKKLFA